MGDRWAYLQRPGTPTFGAPGPTWGLTPWPSEDTWRLTWRPSRRSTTSPRRTGRRGKSPVGGVYALCPAAGGEVGGGSGGIEDQEHGGHAAEPHRSGPVPGGRVRVAACPIATRARRKRTCPTWPAPPQPGLARPHARCRPKAHPSPTNAALNTLFGRIDRDPVLMPLLSSGTWSAGNAGCDISFAGLVAPRPDDEREGACQEALGARAGGGTSSSMRSTVRSSR